MMHELRYALRTLRKSPGFTVTTIVTLALAIGANCSIFSVLNTVLLKPLPFDPENRLVAVYERAPQGQNDYVRQPDLDDWRAMSRSFNGLASWVPQSVTVTGSDRPERVTGMFVSSDFLPVLGVTPAMGRGFAAGEDRPGGQQVALISSGFWRSHFGADPAALGQKAEFNGEPYTIVGVLPQSFVFPQVEADVYLPAFKYPNYSLDRARTSCAVIGRLRPGVSVASARAEMENVAAQLAAAYPATNRGRGATVVSLREDLFARRKPTIIALAGAVAFVLLIACANVAGLMIARMLARERERSVRIALGASRADLFSHVVAEVAILAATGGLGGVLIAMSAIPAIAAAVAVYLPNGTVIRLDGAALLFTLGLSVGSALLVAAVPAWQSSNSLESLRGARGAGSGAARNRVRSLLVAGEMALALVLLAGAGLMARSLAALGRTEPGFDTRNLAMLAYRVPRNRYPSGAQQTEFHRRVVEQIKSVPGVVAATSVRAVPLGDNGSFTDFLLTDRPEPEAAARPRALVNFADPDFFSALRIPLLRGRGFSEHDQSGGTYVVVINQTLARRYFQGRDPIGQQLRLPELHQVAEIVGVVGDIKHFRLDEPPEPQIYGALAQNPFVFTSVAVRAAGDPLKLADAIRRAVSQVDKDQPVWSVYSFDEILANQRNGIHRLIAVTLGAHAVVAVLLAYIGIFGLMSYAVSQRRGEIGVRIALGAGPYQVVKLIGKEGLVLTACGIAAGGIAAAWLSRYLESLLYQVSAVDPAVYGAVSVLLASVALAACVPAVRRAVQVDPVRELRGE